MKSRHSGEAVLEFAVSCFDVNGVIICGVLRTIDGTQRCLCNVCIFCDVMIFYVELTTIDGSLFILVYLLSIAVVSEQTALR